MKKITISYTDEQDRWLRKHPEINRSGAFRKMISFLMMHDSSTISEEDLKIIAKDVEEK